MWSIVAVVAFALALVFRLAGVAQGVLLTWETFMLIGLLALAVAQVVPGWPWRRPPQ